MDAVYSSNERSDILRKQLSDEKEELSKKLSSLTTQAMHAGTEFQRLQRDKQNF